MHVLFVEPAFPRNQRDFVRALHAVGAHVTAIGEAPLDGLDRELKSWLHGYEQVPSVTNTGALYETVRKIQEREWVDRLEATVEAHILPAAKVREACDIPGTTEKTAFLCRDKPAMKEALREAGVPCAQSTGASTPEEAREFVAKVGYPVILKPRDGAGAAGTYRVDNDEELEQAITACHLEHGASVAVEEFIEGHEGFYDTLTINGRVSCDFMCHYFPGVLEAMRTRWISPQVVVTNRIDDETYQEVKEMGQRVIEVLEIETSPTHMEWFFGPKGLKFSEVGCRPPGVRVWDLYSEANDFDIYVEWAKAVTGHGDPKFPSRRYSAGMIALRPSQDGHISGYEGREVLDQLGDAVIDAHFPPPGSQTQGVDGGYMANAWVRAKHPDYDGLRGVLDRIGETIKVQAR